MMRSLWTAGTGMRAQQSNIDVISNNLANVNTTGFKKYRPEFQDLMYQNLRPAGTTTGGDNNQVPTGLEMGHGVKHVANTRLYTQGNFQETGNATDMAIQGDGFFQITMPDGEIAYTRDGSFKIDADGRLTTADGYPLEPAVVIPENATSVTISADGRVSVKIPGQTTSEEIAQLEIARFINPAGLDAIGQNLFKETPASGVPTVSNPTVDGAGSVLQRYLEMSNVQVVEEMVNMIVAQRAYEINSKAITTSDDMLGIAAGLKR
ncbi:flagellar basal-body rod protein FlgG [Succinispira mobilis]|uniref:flagellar basal-body rod protein FlgG n=1 Tax=Succinispira mobilis TaxID=78120 RepID=UPI0003738B9A|nr:flagellar basal-body rod protein FlgG [Succinispira mobilis]